MRIELSLWLYVGNSILLPRQFLRGFLVDEAVFYCLEDRRLFSIEIDQELVVRFSHREDHAILSELLINVDNGLKLILMAHERIKP